LIKSQATQQIAALSIDIVTIPCGVKLKAVTKWSGTIFFQSNLVCMRNVNLKWLKNVCKEKEQFVEEGYNNLQTVWTLTAEAQSFIKCKVGYKTSKLIVSQEEKKKEGEETGRQWLQIQLLTLTSHVALAAIMIIEKKKFLLNTYNEEIEHHLYSGPEPQEIYHEDDDN
jgi:hypothetical protein